MQQVRGRRANEREREIEKKRGREKNRERSEIIEKKEGDSQERERERLLIEVSLGSEGAKVCTV